MKPLKTFDANPYMLFYLSGKFSYSHRTFQNKPLPLLTSMMITAFKVSSFQRSNHGNQCLISKLSLSFKGDSVCLTYCFNLKGDASTDHR